MLRASLTILVHVLGAQVCPFTSFGSSLIPSESKILNRFGLTITEEEARDSSLAYDRFIKKLKQQKRPKAFP
ncbi:hypothetical protein U1Q18_037774 [Sarracenia purpurea var. burkii]